MFKLVSKYLKEISIIILMLGIIRQLVYYSVFGVPIKYFFSLSELWLVISDKLIFISPMILVILWGADILVEGKIQIPALDRSLSEEDMAIIKEREIKESKIERKSKIGFRIILLSFAAIALYYLISTHDYVSTISMSAVLGLLFVLFIVFDVSKYSTSPKVFFGFIICVSIFFIVFFSAIEVRTVQRGKYRGTKIITADTTYISNDTSYFIGKTDQYLFIYNTKDTSTSMIPIESIKKIIFKTRKAISK
jgi:hypothetical protein